MCGKLKCSIWMLSKWNYFGDVLGEGVEAFKNNDHGLWGRHPTDIPASVSLLHETFWTAAGTIISSLTSSPDKVCGTLTSPSMPTTTEEPSWDLRTAVKRASQLAHKICDYCWQCLPPCGPQCSRHAALYALEEIGWPPVQSGPCTVWFSSVQPPQESTKIAVDMGQIQVSVLWWWWCNASSSCL